MTVFEVKSDQPVTERTKYKLDNVSSNYTFIQTILQTLHSAREYADIAEAFFTVRMPYVSRHVCRCRRTGFPAPSFIKLINTRQHQVTSLTKNLIPVKERNVRNRASVCPLMGLVCGP